MILHRKDKYNFGKDLCPNGITYTSEDINIRARATLTENNVTIPVASYYCVNFCRHAIKEESLVLNYVSCTHNNNSSQIGIDRTCI